MAIIVATTGWPLNVAKPAAVTNGQFCFTFTPNFSSASLSGSKRMAQIGTGTADGANGTVCCIAVLGTKYIEFKWDSGGGYGTAVVASWSAGQTMTMYCDTTGAGRFQIYGATTGNGNVAMVGSKSFPAGNMYIGSNSSGGTLWTGSLSDFYNFDHTVAAVEPGLTGAAVGAMTITGTVAGVLPGLTGAAAGAERVNATVAGAEAGLTAAAVGAQTITGTVAGALPGLIATVVSSGAVVGLEAGLVAAAAGAMTITGTVAGSHSGLTGAAAGAQSLAAVVAGVLPGLVAAAAGSERIDGAIAGVEPGLLAFAPSNNDVVGTIAGILPGLTGTMFGGGAGIAGLEAGLVAAAAGAMTIDGAIAGVHAGLVAVADALRINGAVAGVLPGLVAAAAGSERINATVAGVLGYKDVFVPGLNTTALQPHTVMPFGPAFMLRGEGFRFTFTLTAPPVLGSQPIILGGAGSNPFNDNLIFVADTSSGPSGIAFNIGGASIANLSCTWSYGQPITLTVEPALARVTIAGATTGDGQYTINGGTAWSWPDGALGLGGYNSGSAFGRFIGSFSNVEQKVSGAMFGALATPISGAVAGVLPGLVASVSTVLALPITGTVAGVLPGLVAFATDYVPPPGPPAAGGFASSGVYPEAPDDDGSEPFSGGFDNALYPPRRLPS